MAAGLHRERVWKRYWRGSCSIGSRSWWSRFQANPSAIFSCLCLYLGNMWHGLFGSFLLKQEYRLRQSGTIFSSGSMDISCSGECLQCHWLKTNCNAHIYQGTRRQGSREGWTGWSRVTQICCGWCLTPPLSCVCWFHVLLTRKFPLLICRIVNWFLSCCTRFTRMHQSSGLVCQHQAPRWEWTQGNGALRATVGLRRGCRLATALRRAQRKSKAPAVRSLILYCCRCFMAMLYCNSECWILVLRPQRSHGSWEPMTGRR